MSRVERFLAHLDGLAGDVEPQFQPVASTKPGWKSVTAISYRDLPPGMRTTITYGLSLADHSDWRLAKPELLISVQSDHTGWGLAVAFLAEQLRGDCPFTYGETINFGERMAPDSAMTAFLIFAPAVLDPEDYLDIDVGDTLPVVINGCYPIHEVERQYVAEHGIEDFWHQDWDPYDVTRPPAV